MKQGQLLIRPWSDIHTSTVQGWLFYTDTIIISVWSAIQGPVLKLNQPSPIILPLLMQNLNLVLRKPLDPKTSKGGIIFIIIQNQNIHWYANSDPQHALCSVHVENIHSSSSLMYLQLHVESCGCIGEAPDEVSKTSSAVATPLVKLGRYNQQKVAK